MTNSCRKIRRKIIRGMDKQKRDVNNEIQKHLSTCSECAAYYKRITSLGPILKQELDDERAKLEIPDYLRISEAARSSSKRQNIGPGFDRDARRNKGFSLDYGGRRFFGLQIDKRLQGPSAYLRYTRIAAVFILVIGLSILIALSVNNRRIERQVEEEVSVLLETIFGSADYPGPAGFSSESSLGSNRGLFPGSETGFGDEGFVEEIHSSLRRNMTGDA